eukprot:GFYU01020121.1.p1 GENE.GFYU01020121.1~~GFYU01020121.1.p1  ORF type:complete len:338 (-),score=106.45 GFYU01020121.1:23-1036(-)
MSSLQELLRAYPRVYHGYGALVQKLPKLQPYMEWAYSAVDYSSVLSTRQNLVQTQETLKRVKDKKLGSVLDRKLRLEKEVEKFAKKETEVELRKINQEEVLHNMVTKAPNLDTTEAKNKIMEEGMLLDSVRQQRRAAVHQLEIVMQEHEAVSQEIDASVEAYVRAVNDKYEADEKWRNAMSILGFAISVSGMTLGSFWAWYRTKVIEDRVYNTIDARVCHRLDTLEKSLEALTLNGVGEGGDISEHEYVMISPQPALSGVPLASVGSLSDEAASEKKVTAVPTENLDGTSLVGSDGNGMTIQWPPTQEHRAYAVGAALGATVSFAACVAIMSRSSGR